MKCKRVLGQSLLSVALLAAGSTANAEFYIGGAFGRALVESPEPSFGDLVRFGVRVAGGYRFNQHIGIEAMHLNFGSVEDTRSDGSRRTNFNNYGTGAGVAVGAPLTPTWRVDARLGVMQATAKVENRSSSLGAIGSSTTNSTQAWWGLSSAWVLSAPITLQLEYTRTKFEFGFPFNESGRAHLLAFGAYYRF